MSFLNFSESRKPGMASIILQIILRTSISPAKTTISFATPMESLKATKYGFPCLKMLSAGHILSSSRFRLVFSLIFSHISSVSRTRAWFSEENSSGCASSLSSSFTTSVSSVAAFSSSSAMSFLRRRKGVRRRPNRELRDGDSTLRHRNSSFGQRCGDEATRG